jgi:hypothetical protein
MTEIVARESAASPPSVTRPSDGMQPLYEAALPADAEGAWIRRAIDAARGGSGS